MDFQALNGLGVASRAFDILRGKVVGQIPHLGFLFRAPEFWKSISALCGHGEARSYEAQSAKGEPTQTTIYSVTTVPLRAQDVTIVDTMRKA